MPGPKYSMRFADTDSGPWLTIGGPGHRDAEDIVQDERDGFAGTQLP